MEDVKKRADVKELILSVITRLSEDAQNEWKAVKWDDVKATCRRMGISHKETESHFSLLIREVELLEDANDPTSIYMRFRPRPTSASRVFTLNGFSHRQPQISRASSFAPRHRFTVGSRSSSAGSSQELAYPHAAFSDGAAAGRRSGCGSKARGRTNAFGTAAGGRHVQRQCSVESETLEDPASTSVFGFGRLSSFTALTDSRISQGVSVSPSALGNARTLRVKHVIGQKRATDSSGDSSSDDTDLDCAEILVPESPPSDLEDWRQARASASVGILAVTAGFLTVVYVNVLQCVTFFLDGFTAAIKLLRPTSASRNPPESDITDQIPEEIFAAADTLNRPALDRSDDSCTDAQPGLTDCCEVDCKTVPSSDSSPVKDGAIAEDKRGSHALLIAAITMNVASRAPGSISTEDLLLVLRAQYGRDVSPLAEAGVDVPFSEYVRRHCNAVFVDEGPDEQANCLLRKKKSELCGHLRDLLGWAAD